MEHSTKSMRSDLISWTCCVITLETQDFLQANMFTLQRAALSLSSTFLQSFWTQCLNSNPDLGGRMQETWPSREISSAILSRAGLCSVIIPALGKSWSLTILQEREVRGATVLSNPQMYLATWNHRSVPSFLGERTSARAGSVAPRSSKTAFPKSQPCQACLFYH